MWFSSALDNRWRCFITDAITGLWALSSACSTRGAGAVGLEPGSQARPPRPWGPPAPPRGRLPHRGAASLGPPAPPRGRLPHRRAASPGPACPTEGLPFQSHLPHREAASPGQGLACKTHGKAEVRGRRSARFMWICCTTLPPDEIPPDHRSFGWVANLGGGLCACVDATCATYM